MLAKLSGILNIFSPNKKSKQNALQKLHKRRRRIPQLLSYFYGSLENTFIIKAQSSELRAKDAKSK